MRKVGMGAVAPNTNNDTPDLMQYTKAELLKIAEEKGINLTPEQKRSKSKIITALQ